jgi:hypothetical protein
MSLTIKYRPNRGNMMLPAGCDVAGVIRGRKVMNRGRVVEKEDLREEVMMVLSESGRGGPQRVAQSRR